jgi:hypothetical protein
MQQKLQRTSQTDAFKLMSVCFWRNLGTSSSCNLWLLTNARAIRSNVSVNSEPLTHYQLLDSARYFLRMQINNSIMKKSN